MQIQTERKREKYMCICHIMLCMSRSIEREATGDMCHIIICISYYLGTLITLITLKNL